MTTRRTPRRPTWQPLPKTQPVDSARTKALRLPRPGPGIGINVPLSLEPAYLDLYDLVPMTPGEVRDLEKALGVRKPAGVLWVKRVKRDQHGH